MNPSPEGAGRWTYCPIALWSVDVPIISQSGDLGTNEVGDRCHFGTTSGHSALGLGRATPSVPSRK
jgi:hypothetical protein